MVPCHIHLSFFGQTIYFMMFKIMWIILWVWLDCCVLTWWVYLPEVGHAFAAWLFCLLNTQFYALFLALFGLPTLWWWVLDLSHVKAPVFLGLKTLDVMFLTIHFSPRHGSLKSVKKKCEICLFIYQFGQPTQEVLVTPSICNLKCYLDICSSVPPNMQTPDYICLNL